LPRLAFTLAVLLLALLPAAPAAAKLPAGFVGIASEDVFAGDSNYRATNLSVQSAIGVQLARQTFNWSQIEKAPGVYDLSFYDSYVAQASAHGVRILPILFKAPSFHVSRRSGNASCPPRSNASFSAFARALVRRYGPDGTLWAERPDVPKNPITAWQIWNEPNLAVYWCNKPNAKRYVAMLRTVGKAIKKVDRRAEIVTAGLPDSRLGGSVRLAKYLHQVYRAGGKSAFDTLAINSYAKDQRQLKSLLTSVRRLMNRRKDRRAPIWITELGWGDKGPKSRFIVGAKGQAKRITKSFALIKEQRRRLRLRGVVYFSWRDAAPYPPKYKNLWGLHTGLLKIDGSPKPAYHAFKKAVARLR
jgi:polysaccharide biosynthesis protein PslG